MLKLVFTFHFLECFLNFIFTHVSEIFLAQRFSEHPNLPFYWQFYDEYIHYLWFQILLLQTNFPKVHWRNNNSWNKQRTISKPIFLENWIIIFSFYFTGYDANACTQFAIFGFQPSKRCPKISVPKQFPFQSSCHLCSLILHSCYSNHTCASCKLFMGTTHK